MCCNHEKTNAVPEFVCQITASVSKRYQDHPTGLWLDVFSTSVFRKAIQEPRRGRQGPTWVQKKHLREDGRDGLGQTGEMRVKGRAQGKAAGRKVI